MYVYRRYNESSIHQLLCLLKSKIQRIVVDPQSSISME